MSSPPPGFGTAACRWPAEPPDRLPATASLYLQHRLVLAVRTNAQGTVNASTVARDTGIPYKTCQRHLAGTQPLGLDDLLLWLVTYDLDVVNLLPRDLPALVPAAYRGRVRRSGTGDRTGPPSFVAPGSGPDWHDVAEPLAARLALAHDTGTAHLLTAAAVTSDIAHALIRAGTPPGLVTVQQDGSLRVALRRPVRVRALVAPERGDAAGVGAAVLGALLPADSTLVCMLGPEADAALSQAAPQLQDTEPGRFASVRLQDLQAVGLRDVTGADLSVLVAARSIHATGSCVVLEPDK